LPPAEIEPLKTAFDDFIGDNIGESIGLEDFESFGVETFESFGVELVEFVADVAVDDTDGLLDDGGVLPDPSRTMVKPLVDFILPKF
jgi:hypothetical protein